MKVLHVIPHLAPGGAERQLVSTILAGHPRMWDATLCVLNPGYELARQVADHGVEVVELEQHRRRDIRRFDELRRHVTRGGFDVVHSTLWRTNELVRLASVAARRPAIVVSERAVEWHRPISERAVDRLLRPLTDAYIGNSEAVADFIVAAHGVHRDRVSVIRNGVDTSVFHPGARSPGHGTPRIGSVGRLEHQKGYDVLLDALPKVLEETPAEIAIAGDGSLREPLETVASSRGLPVQFVGLIADHGAVADFLRDLDLFVLPTRYEGLPNAILEAAACGVPVVATNAPGVREAVGSEFPLVPMDDPEQLAQAIVEQLRTRTVPRVPVLSFDEVASSHLEVFERARTRR